MAKPKMSLLSKVVLGVGTTVLAGILFTPAIPFVAGAAIAAVAGSEVYNAHKEGSLNSGKKIGATAVIGFAASLIAGAIFPPPRISRTHCYSCSNCRCRRQRSRRT